MNVTAYTFQAVKTVFVELFCTPKSSMENPSLRVSGHSGSTNRTFIVENNAEDEYGQWATDEVTREQGIDDEKSCFLDVGRHRVCLGIQTIQRSLSVKKRKGKGNGKGKGGSKRTGKAYLGEEETRDPERWSEEDCFLVVQR